MSTHDEDDGMADTETITDGLDHVMDGIITGEAMHCNNCLVLESKLKDLETERRVRKILDSYATLEHGNSTKSLAETIMEAVSGGNSSSCLPEPSSHSVGNDQPPFKYIRTEDGNRHPVVPERDVLPLTPLPNDNEEPIVPEPECPRLPPEILGYLFDFLRLKELENCSLVSQYWHSVAATKITKFLIVLDTYNNNNISYILKEKVGTAFTRVFSLPLTEIKAKLRSTKKKMITLELGHDAINSSTLFDLLKEFGAFIRSFHCNPSRHDRYHTMSGGGLVKILSKYLPNLEYLTFDPTALTHTASARNLSQKSKIARLTKLRELTFIQPVRSHLNRWDLIQQILMLAPNIQRIWGLPDDYVTEKEIMEKSHVLKSILYKELGRDVSTNRMIKFLESAQNKELQVEEVRLTSSSLSLSRYTKNKMKETYSHLLQKNKKSLKTLEIEPEQLDNINNISVLEELETIRFIEPQYNPQQRRIFIPTGFNMRQVFPNVNSIEISVDIPDTHGNPLRLFEEYFAPDMFRPYAHGQVNIFEKVTELKLSKSLAADCMERLCAIFPNITSLNLKLGWSRLATVLPLCYRLWHNLEELVLNVNILTTDTLVLDEILTGIRQEQCKLLKESTAEEVEDNVEKFRVKPSICSLKNLQLLKFILIPTPVILYSVSYNPLFSQVSGLYAFELMPNMKVLVEIEKSASRPHRNGLKTVFGAVESFVNFV